ncbi:MAG TPA: DUF2795 domain-containing protein [Mycobacteriales bacterium]
MDRGSSKHSPRMDERLEHEVQGMMKGEGPTHAEEWKEPEPAGEDQADPGQLGEPPDRQPAPPPGMTREEVELRSLVGEHLHRTVFPADVSGLLDALAQTQAPDRLVQLVRQLPTGTMFASLAEVIAGLGLHQEDRRF